MYSALVRGELAVVDPISKKLLGRSLQPFEETVQEMLSRVYQAPLNKLQSNSTTSSHICTFLQHGAIQQKQQENVMVSNLRGTGWKSEVELCSVDLPSFESGLETSGKHQRNTAANMQHYQSLIWTAIYHCTTRSKQRWRNRPPIAPRWTEKLYNPCSSQNQRYTHSCRSP
ncbi:hypothetical protein BC835DRAFT_406886 [Cytidiella melzeri]|nr:hypothetical protein BC835DRAFT_406886 [Cytidiella melzeri]